MICPFCEIEFEPKHKNQKYCTRSHQRYSGKRARRIRRKQNLPVSVYDGKCVVCGVSFSTVQGTQVTCSKDCSKVHRRRTHDTRSGKRKKNPSKIRDYVYGVKLERGCSKCPERRPSCLQFHHLDRSKKEFEISRAKLMSLKRVMNEISKCIILCANCHAVEENGDGYKDADRPKGNQ